MVVMTGSRQLDAEELNSGGVENAGVLGYEKSDLSVNITPDANPGLMTPD